MLESHAPGAVIIVNYMTGQHAVKCIESVLLAPDVADRIFLIDNASGDDSVSLLRETIRTQGWQERICLHQAESNGGFAAGCNIGIELAIKQLGRPAFFLLLNPDARLLPGSLQEIRRTFAAVPAAGILGGLIFNEQQVPQISGHRFPSPITELDDGARLGWLSRRLKPAMTAYGSTPDLWECDWVSGACFVIRPEVIEQCGLLDQRFFLYFEEVDYCATAKKAGWKVLYNPLIKAVHAEGAATGIAIPNRRRPAYWFASRRRYLIRHHGIAGWLVADLLWLVGRASWHVRRMLGLGAKQNRTDPAKFVTDLVLGDLTALFDGAAMRLRREGKQA